MRGAGEVKEHAWLKHFPWKDLYDKTLEPPFQHKIQDAFDSKYCNAPDKIGMNTKERYESIMMQDSYRTSFRDYLFYYNEEDPKDRNNTINKKFFNPHQSLESTIQSEKPNDSTLVSEIKAISNIESKFNKIKQMSNSNSSGSLLRQYKVNTGNNLSSGNTTSNSQMKKSNSFQSGK